MRRLQHSRRLLLMMLLALLLSLSTGCSGSAGESGEESSRETSEETGGENASDNSDSDVKRETRKDFLIPAAYGTTTFGNDVVSIDASSTAEGYLMIRYTGDADRTKLQITTPEGTVYSYTLFGGNYETFPLSGGNGSYHLDVLEHAYDDMYAIAFSQDFDVSLSDEFKPFLYPNQYVWYEPDNEAVKLGAKLSDASSSDLDYVEQVYNYIINNITYDKELAENVALDYLPDIDRTLKSGKGICFDYASLMSAMLRSQGIPTKLMVGYSGEAYHAWISVYLNETGWVDNIIEFDGKGWSLMDPTLAAGNNREAVGKYIGDGNNYMEKYSY